MRYVLLLCTLTLLVACGDAAPTVTPVLPDPSPVPPTVADTPPLVPTTIPRTPTLSTSQQLFATRTVVVTEERTARAGTAIAVAQRTPTPLPSATLLPPTDIPTSAPTAKPTIPPTARAAAPTVTRRPAAQALPPTAVPADCLTPAERAYINQANTIVAGIRTAERTMSANYQADPPYISSQEEAFAQAAKTLDNLANQGAKLRTPTEWQAAQSYWDQAMHEYQSIEIDLTTSPFFFMDAGDRDLVLYRDVLQPLIAARCP